MSCTTAAAKRRRSQAKNGYRHLPPMKRPGYRMGSKKQRLGSRAKVQIKSGATK